MRDDALIYETVATAALTHSETLMPMIDAALKTAGLRLDSIDLYAVTAGPGSFTGLRIGLSAVKGMALPRQTPCAGVSTLEALARCHTGQGVVICALDARRGPGLLGCVRPGNPRAADPRCGCSGGRSRRFCPPL